MSTVVGLERLAANPGLSLAWGRCGLLMNQASVTGRFEPAWQVLGQVLGGRLVSLFGPQHGFAGTAQDNMIETAHSRHLQSGLPVHSLYSETREPTAAMLRGLDTLIIDLQIVGCRIYTWKSTIAGCLRSAKRDGLKVVVLDRPNPLGGEVVEGRVLATDATSFVGQFPMPMRHALTAGEAALFMNRDIKADLEIVNLEGWHPQSLWCDLQRPWVLTSPNLPTPEPVYVYPGMVMLEGTNISEGRGTGLPFQFAGAPYVRDGAALVRRIMDYVADVPGLHLRVAAFEPVAQKWQGKSCEGLQIHVVEPHAVRSYRLALALIQAMADVALDQGFAWKSPPYEYDHVTLPIKLIVGDHGVERHLGPQARLNVADPYWRTGIDRYIADVQPFLLYPRQLRDET